MTVKRCVISLLVSFSILATNGIQAVEYKEYKATRLETEYFEISFDKNEIRVTAFENGDAITSVFPKGSLSSKKGRVSADGTLLFDDLGLLVDGQHYYYDSISSTIISEFEKTVTITFYIRKPSASRTSQFKRGNLVAVGKPVIIEEDDFVRGTVIAIGANIEVYGEVNRDIIAINGDIYIGPDAVARGDVAAVDGRVDVADDASIYGEVYDVSKHRIRLRHRFARDMNDWDFLDRVTYDRVDGLGLYLGVEYRDPDSLLPVFSVSGGYAFNSERWRYSVGLEQTILRQPAIAVGANYYRQLANQDGWILGDDENTVFALLATEDFRDYYEAEGGSLYAKTRPLTDVSVEAGYRYEETGWLDARRHLWSLFGGNKLFSENFNTVSDDFRTAGIAETDTTHNGVLYGHVAWDTRDEDDPFDESAWYVTADFEWSADALSSDFDYRRYMLGVRRYQKINRRATVIARGIFAGSDGYLPMYKRFFLGGLGTLQGYDHKEYMGTRFWLLNTEYRFKFPRLETAVAVFWDMGQIANDRKLDGSVDIKNDVGLAVYFEDDFRVSLSKRLDRSYDDNPIFYVRLDHVF